MHLAANPLIAHLSFYFSLVSGHVCRFTAQVLKSPPKHNQDNNLTLYVELNNKILEIADSYENK